MNSTLAQLSRLLTRVRAHLRAWLRRLGEDPRPGPAALPASTTAPNVPIVSAAPPESTTAPNMSIEPGASGSSASTASISGSIAETSTATLSMPAEAPPRSPASSTTSLAQAPEAATSALTLAADVQFGVPVRQFFRRLVSAGPGGLVVDFAAWGPVPVERFFMALGTAERGERRGPAIAEAPSIGQAFDGFVWD